ncbi:hypothetical protein FBQ82_15315, partial [Anaerolineae bacterium CFX7]|nr:hypothetical protein [Anaerolineae bacterium CFX7]
MNGLRWARGERSALLSLRRSLNCLNLRSPSRSFSSTARTRRSCIGLANLMRLRCGAVCASFRFLPHRVGVTFLTLPISNLWSLTMPIQFEKRERIALITIDRPEVHNAFDLELSRALADAWIQFRDDSTLWVAIVTGAGEKSFSAGADLGAIGEFYRALTPL